MYGQQFADKWKNVDIENVKRVWAEDLDGISGETLKAGLLACKNECEYPPSSAKFYQLCKAMRKPQAQQTYLLPHHKEFNPEVAESNLKKMKDMLNNSRIGGSDEQS
jgi:hypothetical protein